jgi:hypothetical protein
MKGEKFMIITLVEIWTNSECRAKIKIYDMMYIASEILWKILESLTSMSQNF